MPGERLGGFNNGSSLYDAENDIAQAAGARERKEVVPEAEEVVEQSETVEQTEGKAALELPTMSAEEVREQERAEVERDHEELEKAFAGLDLKIEKTPEAYAKFLQSMKDPSGEHRVYSDEQIEDLVFLYGESLSPAAGGDLDPVQPFTAVYEYEGDSSDAAGVVKGMLEDGSVDALAQLLGDNSLRGRVESAVEQADSAEEYNLGETVKENIFQRILHLPVGKKVIAGVTAAAVLTVGIFAGKAFVARNNAPEAKAATEADAGAILSFGYELTEAVPEVEMPTPEAQENVSLWEDESLYQGNVNLSNKDLSALGAESYQNFLTEYRNAVRDEFGAVADYTEYEKYDQKASRNAVNTSIEAYDGNEEGMKAAILEINKRNPQALAFAVASMPEFLRQVGGMEEALKIEDAGQRAAYISEMMTSEGGGELQQRLYAGFEVAVNNENTKVGFENISGPQMSSYISQVEKMDHNTIKNLVPGASKVTRENDPHANLIMKFDKLDDDGNVAGDVTYKLAYREVCANIDVVRVTYVEDDKTEETVVFTIRIETPPDDTPSEDTTPTTTEDTQTTETIEEKDAERTAKNAVIGLGEKGTEDTVITQTPVITEQGDETQIGGGTTVTSGDTTKVEEVTEQEPIVEDLKNEEEIKDEDYSDLGI